MPMIITRGLLTLVIRSTISITCLRVQAVSEVSAAPIRRGADVSDS